LLAEGEHCRWIDLRGVTFVDRHGAAVLNALVARGAQLQHVPPFIATLLGGGLP
jgi:anti-anti-sigma regulatory factor